MRAPSTASWSDPTALATCSASRRTLWIGSRPTAIWSCIAGYRRVALGLFSRKLLRRCPCRRFRLLFWSMSTLPLSEVKARLSEIADEVDRTHERVHVTRNGREYVVLLSAEDLETLEATIDLLRDDAAMIRISAADAAVAAGDVTIAADMAALMDERRQREHRDG